MHEALELTPGERSVSGGDVLIMLQLTVGFIPLISFHSPSRNSGEQMAMCFLKFYKQGN